MRLLILASVLLVGIQAQLLLPHGSCVGRCFEQHNFAQGCQCNYDCETYGNCCSDFLVKCRGVEYGLPVSRQELNKFAQSLWDNDVNRISSSLYTLNPQTTVTNTDGDMATERLIIPNDNNTFEAALADHNSTYPSFIKLLNNYVADKSHSESHPDKEIQEEVNFWNAIQKTQVLQLTFRFLRDKGYVKGDIRAFHALFNELWFELYPHSKHSTAKTDSGFEHVMVGETSTPKNPNNTAPVTGLNNWVRFYEEEKAGRLDYMGNIRSSQDPDMVDARFSWHKGTSRGSSFFVGTSPEFDMCLFTVCAVVNPNKQCSVTINSKHINIHTTSIKQQNLQQITAANPYVPKPAAVIG